MLIGVLVTQALIDAIQQITANDTSTEGNTWCIINPKVAPTKNNGIIKPPRHPEVTVTEIAIILNTSIAVSNATEYSLNNNSLISWCPKYRVIGR